MGDKSKKSQKEALLEERIRKIRENNEKLLKRKQEVEDDIKYANLHSEEVARKTHQGSEHKMAGVRTETTSTNKGRARGRILAKMSKETPKAHILEERRKQDFDTVEKGMKAEIPPKEVPSSGSHFLADDRRRVDMSKAGSRSSHSWGGNQFDDVVERIKKDKGQHRSISHQNSEVSMTGKERKEYQHWKEERHKIDEARKQRQMKKGGWKREWDHCKDDGRPTDSEKSSGFEGKHQPRGEQRFGQGHPRSNLNYHDDRGLEIESHKPRQNYRHDTKQDDLSEDWEDDISPPDTSQQAVSTDYVPQLTRYSQPGTVKGVTKQYVPQSTRYSQPDTTQQTVSRGSVPQTEDDWEESCTQVISTSTFSKTSKQEVVASSEVWESLEDQDNTTAVAKNLEDPPMAKIGQQSFNKEDQNTNDHTIAITKNLEDPQKENIIGQPSSNKEDQNTTDHTIAVTNKLEDPPKEGIRQQSFNKDADQGTSDHTTVVTKKLEGPPKEEIAQHSFLKEKITINVDREGKREIISVDTNASSNNVDDKNPGEGDWSISGQSNDEQVVSDKAPCDVKPQRLQSRERAHRQTRDLSDSKQKIVSNTAKKVDQYVTEQEDDYIGINPDYQELPGTVTSIPVTEESHTKKHVELSKLIIKEQEEEEPIPDFLITPKEGKGDWAECAFDEEKLGEITIEWAS